MSVGGFINSIILAAAAKAPIGPKTVKGDNTTNGSSFYKYVEQKVGSERKQGKNLLGAAARPKKVAAQQGTGKSKPSSNDKEDGKQLKDASVAELLALLMQELQKVSKDADAGPGQWSVNISEQGLLQKLANDAGMGDEKISLLLQQMENQDGKLDLNDLLASLTRHFEELDKGVPVTVPETDLPLLETFLSKMGVSPPDVEKIAADGVRGDNTLDLAKFLQDLQDLDIDPDNTQTITLTDWEAEQLQDILAKAGVSEQMQRELLPERIPSWLNPAAENKPVQLSLARLQEMLTSGVQEVQDNQPQADLPAFLKDLDALLAKTGFEEKTVGWSPVVHEAVTAIYDKLMESVDPSTVQVENAGSSMQKKQEPVQETKADPEKMNMFEDQAGGPALKADSDTEPQTDGEFAGQSGESSDSADLLEADLAPHQAEEEKPAKPFESNTLAHQMKSLDGGVPPPNDVKPPPVPPAPRLPFALQQQTLQTITQGVLQGLNDNEHHLVLRLYPKELGEVKVEMLVRDDHVAVSFSMENSKVKETLESHMDQFRHNLEKQGFVLEECMVSVGQQQDDSSDAWRQFESAWKNNKQGGSSVAKMATLADLPENVLYLRSQAKDGSLNGIDLFA